MRLKRFIPLLALLFGSALLGGGRAVADPWIVVSDVHYDPFADMTAPSTYGHDTNGVLLDSTLDEMRKVDPDAPVIVITGDFLAHNFRGPYAASTMQQLAQRFGRRFPDAQFVIALGNNDAACGDYQTQPDSPFLKDVADAWAPLVNRRNAAPNFARTFPHLGAYVTSLPVRGLRAVVVDDVFLALRYKNACGDANAQPANETLSWLRTTLQTHPTSTWLIAHIPVGIDAFTSTQIAHQILIVPFLQPAPQSALLALVNDPHDDVKLVLSGHAHKFAYRLTNGDAASPNVPVLLAPSVSPVYNNNPSFLTLDVAKDGTPVNVSENSFDGTLWKSTGTLRDLGVNRFDAKELLALQARLAAKPQLRTRYANMYGGDASKNEIDESNWRAYWCAATALTVDGYRTCTADGTSGAIPSRSYAIAGFAVLAGAGAVAAVRLAQQR